MSATTIGSRIFSRPPWPSLLFAASENNNIATRFYLIFFVRHGGHIHTYIATSTYLSHSHRPHLPQHRRCRATKVNTTPPSMPRQRCHISRLSRLSSHTQEAPRSYAPIAFLASARRHGPCFTPLITSPQHVKAPCAPDVIGPRDIRQNSPCA